MRNTLLIVVLLLLMQLFSPASYGTGKGSDHDEFYLSVLDNWESEIFIFPLKFSPTIELDGFEELRFPPGMFNLESPNYWSYLFVWWVDSEHPFQEEQLERYLEKYFLGLSKEMATINDRKASVTKYKVTLNATSNDQIMGSSTPFEPNVIAEIPPLNLKIDQYLCASQNRLAVIFELSPKPYKDQRWVTLAKLKQSFRCGVVKPS